jgi:hypothetical protein
LRQGSAEEEGGGGGEGEEPATLDGGDVWLAVETAEAGGELTVQCSPLFIVHCSLFTINFLFPMFLIFFLRASGYCVVT